MNAIKNTIVTITLIAVGYGAYVVLQDPQTDSLGENELNWDANDTEFGLGAESVDAAAQVENKAENLLSNLSAPSGPPAEQLDDAVQEVADTFNAPAPVLDDPVNTPISEPTFDAPNYDEQQDLADSTYDQPYETAPTAGDESFYNRAEETTSQFASTTTRAPNDAQEFAAPSGNDGQFQDANSGSTSFGRDWAEVEALLQQEQLGDSLLRLSKYYRDPTLDSQQATQLLGMLDQLAGSVIYSHKSFLEPNYEVRSGESLNDIANRYRVPVEFLGRINGLESNYRPIAGEMLKVVRGPFNARVDLGVGELTVFLGEYYAGRFRIRVGQKLPRTDAVYEVIEKAPGREFFDPKSGYRIAKDDPANPYGGQWIGLRGDQITAAHNIGIHIATDNEVDGSIGVSETDAFDLGTILSIGSKVTVLR